MGNVYLEERQINLCMGVFYMVVLIIFGVLWRSKKKGENFETKFEYIILCIKCLIYSFVCILSVVFSASGLLTLNPTILDLASIFVFFCATVEFIDNLFKLSCIRKRRKVSSNFIDDNTRIYQVTIKRKKID